MLNRNKRIFSIAILAVLVFSLVFTGLAGARKVYAAGASQYTVKAGDSLYLIAKSYGVTISSIKAANSMSFDTIYPGQVLNIPSAVSGVTQYTVKAGDSLYLISRNYGVTINEIKAKNNLSSDIIYPGQKLDIPSTGVKPLKDILAENGLLNNGVLKFGTKLDIFVDKTDHTLSIRNQGVVLKTYHVELGDGGIGDKQVSGDHKTPEGSFAITQKSVLSPVDPYLGSRWMRLGYPNIEDAARGLQQGLIDKATYDSIVSAINNGGIPPQRTALGGGVGIHGGSTPELGSDWTWGCVGLTNKDVEDFYNFVDVGTNVIIQR